METTAEITREKSPPGQVGLGQRALRKWAAPLAVVAGAGSFVMLQVALQRDSAVRFLSWILAGAFVGGIALLALSHLVQKHVISGSPTLPWIVGSSAGFVGLAMAWIGMGNESVFLATAGVGIGILALVVLTEASKEPAVSKPELWLLPGVLLLAIAVLLPTTQVVVAVLVGTVGIAMLKAGSAGWISPTAPTRTVRSRHVLLVGLVLVAVAIAFGITASEREAAARVVLLGYAGLSLLAMAATILVEKRSGASAIALGVGLLCAASGFWLVAGLFPNWRGLVFLVGAVGLVAGSFFVFRGEAIVAMVLLGALLGWVLVDRTQDWQPPQEPAGLIVSLGDSFAAGQGTSEFLPGTNTVAGDVDGTCRRSVHAYAFIVGAALGYDVESLACSGADIDEVAVEEGTESAQERQYGKPTQVERLGVDVRAAADLVLISVGVNDAGFSKVLTLCILPSRCDAQADDILDVVDGIESKLDATYRRILRDFPNATVVVVAYPPLVGHDPDCGRSMVQDEQAFANEYVRKVNASIKAKVDSIASGRLVLFADLGPAFVGRTLCDPTPGANFAHLLPKSEGSVLKRLGPTNWHSGTGHPNNLGHLCVGEALIGFLVDKELVERPAPEDPLCDLAKRDEVTAAEAATRALIDGRETKEADPLFDLEKWREEQIDRLVARSVIALTLLMLAGALTAMVFAPRLRTWPADVLVPDWLQAQI